MMAADSDEIHEGLITCFTPRLRNLIMVQHVLDLLDFIKPDQKERVKQTNTSHGNVAAAEALITAVTQKPHQPGWFRAFVDALERSGCGLAADYIQNKIPETEVEAENDYCVRLIQLLSSSLVDMKTSQVCLHCVSQDLITEDDIENVSICYLLHIYHFHIREKFHENNKTSLQGAWMCLRGLATRWQTRPLNLSTATLHCDCANLLCQYGLCCLLPPDPSCDYKPRS